MSVAPPNTPASTPAKLPTTGYYVLAFCIPIVGFILAIGAWARDQVGPGLALITVALCGGFTWSAFLFANAIGGYQ